MAIRAEIEKRIEKKREEIAELEMSLREARSYVQALEDTLKVLPRDGANEGQAGSILRPSSRMAKAREAILSAGRPLYVHDIMKAIGLETTARNRAALSGAIGAYVRKGEIFTRPAPNTYGLIELENTTVEKKSPPPQADADEDEPPDYFGASER